MIILSRRIRRLPVLGAALAVVAVVSALPGGLPAQASIPADGIHAMAWGNNFSGELGDGTVVKKARPTPLPDLMNGVRQLAGGFDYSLGLRADGTVMAWGANHFGQLGDGTVVQRLRPVPVVGLTDVVQVAANNRTSAALAFDGTVWTWGSNADGKLGDGTIANRSTPKRVAGLTDVVGIAVGWTHMLAVRSDGTVWAWGQNTSGQLGFPNSGPRLTPVQVPDAPHTFQVTAGNGTSYAVDLRSREVYAWGANQFGQLGDGTRVSHSKPSPVFLSGPTQRVIALADHALAVQSGGTVLSWGSNADGQLGNGTTTDRLRAAPVPGIAGAIDVAVGRSHSYALLGDGTVRSWGSNEFGMLGDGSGGSKSLTPVTVLGLNRASQIASGSFHGLVTHAPAPPGFSMTVPPGDLQVEPGGTVSVVVGLDPFNGFTGAAAAKVDFLPGTVTARASNLVRAGTTATVTVKVPLEMAEGRYPVRILLTALTTPNLVREFDTSLVIAKPAQPKPEFAIQFSEPFGAVRAGESVTTEVQVVMGNLIGSAVLSAQSLPDGVTVSFDPGVVSAATPARMTVHTRVDAPQGTYVVQVSASAGGTTRSAPYFITIDSGDPAS